MFYVIFIDQTTNALNMHTILLRDYFRDENKKQEDDSSSFRVLFSFILFRSFRIDHQNDKKNQMNFLFGN